jgi:hypothetical protein
LITGIVIIAAYAGGTWPHIGNVIVTMLLISGQVTTIRIAGQLFSPCDLSTKAVLFYVGQAGHDTDFPINRSSPPVGLLAILRLVLVVSELIHLDKDSTGSKSLSGG